MAEQGAVVGAGQPFMGVDPATGIGYMAALNPNTRNLIVESAASAGNGQPYNYTPLSPGQFGLGCASSIGLTIPSGALQCVVCAEGADVRFTYDGTTTPTATIGQKLPNGSCIQFSGAVLLAALRFIQTAATATLNVSYTK